ncbi:hypothetical protein ACIA5D_05980 [Actinoplanes sp. NPDC051513]
MSVAVNSQMSMSRKKHKRAVGCLLRQ